MSKLVRDYIPKLIEEKGQHPVGYVASDDEYQHRIIDKLIEEVKEFKESKSIEELADILEVVDHIYKAFGFMKKAVERIKSQKKHEKGGFKSRYILERVERNTLPDYPKA